MNKTYRLYEIKLVNNLHMFMYVTQVSAHNIVEAEFMLEAYMLSGMEYNITVSK